MQNMPHIASRVLNKPLLLEPGYARTFFSALAPRIGITELHDASGEILTGEKMRISAGSFNSQRDRDRPYEVVNGVAVIPVSGSLVHKFGHLRPYSGMTGYDGIIARAAQALADPEVKGILADYDTPGGEVSGCFDTARKLREMADAAGKPFWSLCYDMACSAGMALSSAAHRRLITATGIAGSVGVVMAHVSYEDFLKEEGITVTLIHSGAQKVDGNPYAALPVEVLGRFQTETDALRREFAQIVATHTGMSLDAVLATEAATYRGQAAIDVGFAHELINGIDAVSHFADHLSTQGRTISIGATMSNDSTPVQAAAPEQPSPAAEAIAPTAEHQPAAPVASTPADSAAAEQQRIAGILQHPSAQGRASTANHLAFNTRMSVEEAAAMLATVPEGATGAADMTTALDQAMANVEQPNVGADSASEEAAPNSAAHIVSCWKRATGAK